MDRLNGLLTSYKYPLLAALVGIILVFSGSLTEIIPAQIPPQPSFPPESLSEKSPGSIKVDIAGAVHKPGVYDFADGARVEDLIEEAGGFLPEVNNEYVSKSLNLSQKVSDGQKFYIPFKGESLSSTAISVTNSSGSTVNTKVNLNTASQSDLESLPGIGPTTAGKIIAGRPFKSINEIQTNKVVGKAAFEKIKDLVEI